MSKAEAAYGSLPLYTDLPFTNSSDGEVCAKKEETVRFLRILTIIGFLFLFGVAFSAFAIRSNRESLSKHVKFMSLHSNFSVTSYNEYGNSSEAKANMFSYPFLDEALLLEPFRNNNIVINTNSSDCSYSWSLTGISVTGHDLSDVAASPYFQVIPTKPGHYNFEILENCDGTTSASYSNEVWVKYVRRELSSLTDQDREEFLDALYTLWTVNTVNGKILYGEDYKSLQYFAVMHNDAGGNVFCDEFHGGPGFLNNHLFLSSYLEKSLQLVNPRVALHYMEYIKYFSSVDFQLHLDYQLDGGLWTEMLSDKFFGSSDPVTGRILDGRWAGWSLPQLTENFFVDHGLDSQMSSFFTIANHKDSSYSQNHVTSPYGYLRSPWNWNPANYTTRYNNAYLIESFGTFLYGVEDSSFSYLEGSNCEDLQVFQDTKVYGQPLASLLSGAEDDIHGKIHFTFGGFGGYNANKVNDQLQELGLSQNCIGETSFASQAFFKKLYVNAAKGKDVVYSCSTNPWQNYELTSTAIPGDADGPSCSCADTYFESEDNLNDLIKIFSFGSAGVSACNDDLENMDFESRKTAMSLICGRMSFDGDMAGSGAATDPLFWVAHGALERLFQFVIFENTLTDYSYPEYSTRCTGHDTNGTKAWLSGMKLMDETILVDTLTNRELTEILDPRTDRHRDLIDYVYDANDYSYCNSTALLL